MFMIQVTCPQLDLSQQISLLECWWMSTMVRDPKLDLPPTDFTRTLEGGQHVGGVQVGVRSFFFNFSTHSLKYSSPTHTTPRTSTPSQNKYFLCFKLQNFSTFQIHCFTVHSHVVYIKCIVNKSYVSTNVNMSYNLEWRNTLLSFAHGIQVKGFRRGLDGGEQAYKNFKTRQCNKLAVCGGFMDSCGCGSSAHPSLELI